MELECVDFSFDKKDHCWLELTNGDEYIDDHQCSACNSTMEDFVSIVNQDGQVGLTTGICNNCGYIKRTRNLKHSSIDAHFADRWLNLRAEDDFKENGSVFQYIKPFLVGNESTVLDVGCGNGDQLITFEKNGFQTYGVEPSISRSETARKNLSNSNITNNFSQDFLRNDQKLYDIIYIENVLQFVENPFELLDLASNRLRMGGLLYIKAQRFEWSNFAMFSFIAIIRSYLDLYSLQKTIEENGLNILKHQDFPFILVFKKGDNIDISTKRKLASSVKVDQKQIGKIASREFLSLRARLLGTVNVKNKAMNRSMQFRIIDKTPPLPIKIIAKDKLPVILK